MKKYVSFLLVAALLTIFIPASARSGDDQGQDPQLVFLPLMVRMVETGERISIFESGSQTFPENTPFHIVHGWSGLDPADDMIDQFGFLVDVGGVYSELAFIYDFMDQSEDPPTLVKRFVYNFPEGMKGTHLFTGHWIAPCYAFYDDCEDPLEIYEGISEVFITFIP